MNPLQEYTVQNYAVSLSYVVLGFIVLVVAKVAKDLFTPFKIDEELTSRDNPALGIAVAGYFAGVVIIFLGAIIGPDDPGEITSVAFLRSIGVDLLYAIGGIVALNVGRGVVDKLVLYKFSTVKEIITDRNIGTGAVECGCFIATALIVAGAIHGESGNHASGVLTAVVFFVLGQLVLVLFTRCYQWATKYDVHEEIEKDNVAAGVALGASMIALGIVILRGTAGDFVGWGTNLTSFAIACLLGFVLLTTLRKVTDWMLLPGTTIAVEIARDRNINAAWIEGVVAIGMAAIIFFTI